MRVVREPDGSVALDPTGRRNGRGAYLCADAACWRLAAVKGTLARALGTTLGPAVLDALATGPELLVTGRPEPLAGNVLAAAPATAPTDPDPTSTIEGGARGQE